MFLISFPDFFDDFGNKEGKNEKGHREENLERKELPPVPRGPDFFKVADEKGKDEGSHQNPRAVPAK